MNLSNASRIEAINTFDQLSQRLSRSSLALVPLSPSTRETGQRHQQRRRKKSVISSSKHARSKSAPELSVTSQGWVRPKAGTKQSSDSAKPSKESGSASSRHRTSKSQSSQPPVAPSKQSVRPQNLNMPPVNESRQRTPPPQYTTFPIEPHHRRMENRKSFMSFASDSTKIGEIPEHKWAQTAAMQASNYPRTIYYPVEPYQKPEKQRSRLMKLFRK